MKLLLSMLIMFSMNISVYAGIFYVSINGNDATGDGSQAKPWKTVRNAMLTVTSPGNTIHVIAGTYTESTSTLNLATGVNLEGDGATTTIIKSTLTGQWSTFLNLESNSLVNGNQTISGITFDGGYTSSVTKTWFGIWATLRSNITIRDCVIQNFFQRGVIINGNGHNEEPVDPKVYATGIQVLSNKFINCGGNDGNTYGQLNIGGTKDALIQYNTMDQTQRSGTSNGECIKYWGSGYNPGLKIFDNTLKRANHVSTQYNGSNGDWNFAIELFNNTGLEIARNNIQGSIDINYQRIFSPYTKSVWIHDNTFDHNPVNNKEEQGIIFEFETNQFVVENNKFLNQSTGITFNVRPPNNDGGFDNPPVTGGYSATTNGIIRNNLFTLYNLGNGICCSREGIQFYVEGETQTAYARNIEISNNTFVNLSPAQSTCLDFEYFGVQSNGTPAMSGLTVKNNIFIGFTSRYLFGGASMANVSITNNCVWNCGNNNNAVWNTNASFPESNLKVNPALDANYLVTASSPLFGQGIGYQSTGTPPPPTPCSYSYGPYGPCKPDGTQDRQVLSVSPVGCVQNPPPVLSQSCVVIPPADTTFCSVVIHLPATGNIATKRNLTYFVRRSDGFLYDNTGTKLDIILYKQGSKWVLYEK